MDENVPIVTEVLPSTSVIGHNNIEFFNEGKYAMIKLIALIYY